MKDDCGSNVHAGLEYTSSGTKFFVRLREVSALEDVRLREVPLYSEFENNNIIKSININFIPR